MGFWSSGQSLQEGCRYWVLFSVLSQCLYCVLLHPLILVVPFGFPFSLTEFFVFLNKLIDDEIAFLYYFI